MIKVYVLGGLIAVVLLGGLIAFLGYKSSNPTPDGIVFMRYPGTNICFATKDWDTQLQTMATVRCEDVPMGKLHTFENP